MHWPSWLKALAVSLSRPSGCIGSRTSLIGFNPRQLKRSKDQHQKETSLCATDLSCLCEVFYFFALILGLEFDCAQLFVFFHVLSLGSSDLVVSTSANEWTPSAVRFTVCVSAKLYMALSVSAFRVVLFFCKLMNIVVINSVDWLITIYCCKPHLIKLWQVTWTTTTLHFHLLIWGEFIIWGHSGSQ